MKMLSIHGRRMAVADYGDGMPLVLVHGFPLDHSMWSAQIRGLSSRFRVLAPDLRGFGLSEPTEGAVTMAQFAGDLAAILDILAIREPVALAGLSMGGYIALEFYRRHRDKLAALILCDTRAAADSMETVAVRLRTAEQVVKEGMAPLGAATPQKLFAPATLENHPKLALTIHDAIMAASPVGVAAAARGMAERHDMTGLLASIDCPTLVVVGEHDAIATPDEMRGIAAAIPGSQFAEISGAAHLSPLENPTAVNTAIAEFLAPLADGRSDAVRLRPFRTTGAASE